MNLDGKRVILHDMSLRDGMHACRHQISIEDMVKVACALDEAGMPLIEVTHGDGLGGASINYGFAAQTDEEYLKAVCPKMKNAKISALLLPGIGTVDDLKIAVAAGVSTILRRDAPVFKGPERGRAVFGAAACAHSATASAGAWVVPARKRSASSAAMQPVPAAVTAWRNTLSCTSPAA